MLGIVCFGAFATALDQTVVVTALPSVMLDLKVSINELDRAAWIVTAYLLGYTAAMPLMGRIADVYGYSRVYQGSLILFAVGSSLVALSPNLEWMVSARVVQAIGGGATVPIGMAIASMALPAHRRGLAIGMVVAAAEAGSMLGPAYGGAIVELADWRWIFWLNLPQAAVLFVALRTLPSFRRRGDRVDYLGGMMLAVALVLLSLALSRSGSFDLSSITPFLIGVPGLALVAGFVWLQLRHPREESSWQPLLPPFVFRSWAFISANITQVLEGTALIIAMVTIPLMANTVMGKDPLTGGWWLLRMTAAIPIGAIAGGYLLSIFGVRPVTMFGLGLCALGLFLISTWDLGIGEPWLTVHLAIAGLGFGLNNAPIMTRALGTAGEDYRGTVASLVTVSRMMGMALGLAALSAWGVEHFLTLTASLELPILAVGETVTELELRQEEYRNGLINAGLTLFHRFFIVAAVVALVAMLSALAMRSDERKGLEPH